MDSQAEAEQGRVYLVNFKKQAGHRKSVRVNKSKRGGTQTEVEIINKTSRNNKLQQRVLQEMIWQMTTRAVAVYVHSEVDEGQVWLDLGMRSRCDGLML